MTQIDTAVFDEIIDALVEPGWIVRRGLFPDDYLRELVAEVQSLWQAGDFRRAKIGQGDAQTVQTEIRSDFIHWLDPQQLTPLQQRYWDFIQQLRETINRTLYLGLVNFEAHFAVYPAGAFYKKHLDQFKTTQHRMVTCLLYLNEAWQAEDGGQLRIYDPADPAGEAYQEVLPTFGTFVCFRSDLIYHEVRPSRRERFSLTGWLRKEILL
jgi:SM-20-related protein